MSKRKKKMNFAVRTETVPDLAEQLKIASQGLYYISETDAEIFPFIGSKAESVTKEEVLRQTNNRPDVPVEEREFSEIFSRLTRMQDWFGEREKAAAEKFTAIRELLERNLTDLKVYKIGNIQIDIYFVGLDGAGKLAGIQTKAVET